MSFNDGMSTPTATTTGANWQTGMNLLTAGKTAEAIAVLQNCAQNQPSNFESHHHLGVALAQSKRFEEAISALQKAVKINAQSAQARFNLGLALEGANRQQAARQEFLSALQIDPKYAAATHAISRLDAAASTPLATSSNSGSTPWASGESSTHQLGAQQKDEIERLAKPHVLNILGGIAAGFVAAILCAFLWDKLAYYTDRQFFYAAIGVGFLVGTAVLFGAGGKRGISLQIISALLALGGILLGQTLLIFDYAHDSVVKTPALAASISNVDLFFYSLQSLPDFFKESPISAIFGLFGLGIGWTIPGKIKEETAPEATATDAAPAPSATAANAPLDNPPLNGPPRA